MRSDKWLLIGDGEIFLSFSFQDPINIILTNHPDGWKKFRINYVIPYLQIFQTHLGNWRDW